ncbi:MAG: type IV pilus biogenesis protein PilP [Alphaproteobacteria bacterium]|uniref:Type IV pilus biogenesis protein PilP n=1 Tax=Candidatus Nitrobium versatile TaxID=2884831 RepID=A0A953LXG4_9BACT|nr:type IV pilus biogenesis protein PilP [Candidatus Nitrobium versatile]
MILKEILAAKFKRKQKEDEEEEPIDVTRDEERKVSEQDEEEVQGKEQGDTETPVRKKPGSLTLVMFVTLVLLTGLLVYKRLPSASQLYKKDIPGSVASSTTSPLAAASQATGAAAPSSSPATTVAGGTGSSSPAGSAAPASSQQQKPVVPAQTVQVASASPSAQGQAGKSLYIPARDILSGSSTAELQRQEEVNRLLEAQLKERKLKNDIKKIEGDIEILPFQVTDKKKELTEKIEKKANFQPVLLTERESRPPTLYSVQMVEGVMTGSFTLMTGERVGARVGESVGEFTVKELTHASASLEGRNGRRHLVSMSLPDRYPVSSPLFAAKSSGTGPSAQAPSVAGPSVRQPISVPISPVGRQ